jgi:hypothetical protein
MRRRLLNLLTAVSLLVCLAACAMWARGRFFEDIWVRTTPMPGPGDDPGDSALFDHDRDHDYVTSGHGRLVIGRDRWTMRGRKWDPFPPQHVSPRPWRHQARPPGKLSSRRALVWLISEAEVNCDMEGMQVQAAFVVVVVARTWPGCRWRAARCRR